jgi:hypothetical protein
MDTTTIFQIITGFISVSSLVVAYMGFRDKRNDNESKEDKELADRIKANVLTDVVSVKVDALAKYVTQKDTNISDSMALKSIEIKDLQTSNIELALQLNTMQEQIRTIIRDQDKVDNKLDKILEIVHNDRRNNSDDDSN